MGQIKTFKAFAKIVEKVVIKNSVNYHQDFSTEIGGDIARDTAIDTGKATANWNGSVNAPDVTSKKIYDKSASAMPTKARIQKKVSKSKKGDTIFISNGVVGENENGKENGEGYIIGLERGKSMQAPNGMVLINVARAKAISKRALKK